MHAKTLRLVCIQYPSTPYPSCDPCRLSSQLSLQHELSSLTLVDLMLSCALAPFLVSPNMEKRIYHADLDSASAYWKSRQARDVRCMRRCLFDDAISQLIFLSSLSCVTNEHRRCRLVAENQHD